jgi:DNA-binding GntR family transcriptional regulator
MIQNTEPSLYDSLKADIISGHFAPGSKLKMDALKTRYGSGVNVIRECLARLATEDLVNQENQKGFRVADLSFSRLDELTRLRILLESDGVRQSMVNGTIDWESDLVAAHHKLAYIEARMNENQEHHYSIWHQNDYEFHRALIAACDSELHINYHMRIFDQFRQFVTGDLRTEGFRGSALIIEHETILKAALARDFDTFHQALEQHLSHYLRKMQGQRPAL